MTPHQLADLIIGLSVLVPPLLILAGWLYWSAWRKARADNEFIDAHRHWLGRRF